MIGTLEEKMITASGRYISLSDPDPATLCIEDIASGLSKLCRYGGQCPKFYSVAEHSLLCYCEGTWSTEHSTVLRSLLLHDAAEAYLGDVIRPLKIRMAAYQEIEDLFEEAIEEAFDVDFSHPLIKECDNRVLKAEKLAFWPDDKKQWSGFKDIQTINPYFSCYDPKRAEELFLTAWSFVK